MIRPVMSVYSGIMKRVLILAVIVLVGAFIVAGVPPTVSCPCDHAKPETLSSRLCSLCRTAEEQESEFYILKDINPRKPNRHLVLPREHGRDLQGPSSMTTNQRARYWRAGIERAKELHGDNWGLASNGNFFRTQCHAHIHIGRLSRLLEHEGGELHRDTGDFPNPGLEHGMWVHARQGQYCVHTDRDLAEVVLVR